MSNIQAFILAGGPGERLGVLTKHRAQASVPFGGRYRIIDFVLSNCVNSRIQSVQIAAQYAPRSLQRHIGLGRPWDLDRRDGGIMLLLPYTGREDSLWYRGTADALYRNLDMLTSQHPSMVLVLSGDQVYRLNYGEMIRQHLRNRAQATVAVKRIDPRQCRRFGMVELDGARIVRFEEKPAQTDMHFANLAVYLFETRWLVERLHEMVEQGKHDLVYDLIVPAVDKGSISAYRFDGYWEDVGELDAFYNANRSLLPAASEYLWDRRWPIYTRSEERPPTRFGSGGSVDNSIIANGCRIHGRIERSVLFPGVVVGKNSLVRDSIVFSGAAVQAGAQVRRCILDKRSVVGAGAHVGAELAVEAELGNAGELQLTSREGLTVVGKETRIPEGFERSDPFMIDSHLDENAVLQSIDV